MHNEPIIGVLGGMGPYAGLDLVRKIFDRTRAGVDQEHLPVALLSYAHRIQDRSAFLFDETTENPALAIAEVARQLDGLRELVDRLRAEGELAEEVPRAWSVAVLDSLVWTAWQAVAGGGVAAGDAAGLAVRTFLRGVRQKVVDAGRVREATGAPRSGER